LYHTDDDIGADPGESRVSRTPRYNPAALSLPKKILIFNFSILETSSKRTINCIFQSSIHTVANIFGSNFKDGDKELVPTGVEGTNKSNKQMKFNEARNIFTRNN
jgi:hypothetical protein